ncbi:MAG: chlorite dismutase family protein [Brachybacterium sp.]|nr:chlorite dismutase family protein [Brachybacterium sp.]
MSTYYTSYTVFDGRAGRNGPSPEDAAQSLRTAIQDVEASGVVIRGFYDVSLFRAEDTLMVWLHGERPEALQDAIRTLERSAPLSALTQTWSAVGVHREAEFSKSHAPAFLSPSRTPQEWITVYPFTRSYEWYLLPEEERREMLIEHGRLGREYPQIHANTVAAFALGDWEWMLSFEAEDLHDLVDMMRRLRYSQARLHVRDELPFHTGRRLADPEAIVDILL